MMDERSKVGINEEASKDPYHVFVRMENLTEKLKLLNYEKGFCKLKHHKPLTRHYFAIPTNPGEQFHCFTSLATWLIQQIDLKLDVPNEYDDPNSTISTIIDAVHCLGYKIEFSPTKLRSGCGEYCILILDSLADSCLNVRNYKFKMPVYKPEEDDEDMCVQEDKTSDERNEEIKSTGLVIAGRFRHTKSNEHDQNLDEFAENDLENDEEEEEEDKVLLDLNKTGCKSNQQLQSADSNNLSLSENHSLVIGSNKVDNNSDMMMKGILESQTNPADWQLEVERILPQLKLATRAELKDWRSHLEKTKHYKKVTDTTYSDVKVQLNRLYDDLCKTLDKITSREKHLNNQIQSTLTDYRLVQDNLNELTNKYQQASMGLTMRTQALTDITEELEKVKSEMDEKGSSMTDGSPVIRIKQAIQRLKSEMVNMDIRIGVLENILLKIHLRAHEVTQNPIYQNAFAY